MLKKKENLYNFAFQSTLMNIEKHKQDLEQIRSLMEESTRFLSLSGLSGVMAGIYSLIGAYFVLNSMRDDSIEYIGDVQTFDTYYFIIAICVIVFASITGFFLTYRSAKKNGQSLFTKTAFRMLAYIGFPLLIGGVFSFAMYIHEVYALIPSIMLIFYGLGLINGSKYTLNDVRTLGIIFAFIGCVSLFFLDYGMYFWALGFGVMHIVYGIRMWFKYEK